MPSADDHGDNTMSMLSLRSTEEEISTLSLPLVSPELPPPNMKNKIDLDDEESGWVKVGVDTTNEQMRRWF